MFHAPMRNPILAVLLALALLPAPVFSFQDSADGAAAEAEAGDGEAQPEEPEPIQDSTAQALVALTDLIQGIRKELEDAIESLKPDLDPAASKEIEDEIARLREELAVKLLEFRSYGTGMDAAQLDQQRGAFDLKAELQELVRPLLEELKEATKAPRTIEDLRSKVEWEEEQVKSKISSGKNIDLMIGKIDDELDNLPSVEGLSAEVRESTQADLETTGDALKRLREQLAEEQSEHENALKIARSRLDNQLASQTSVIETSREFLSTFFRTRGLNLVLALLAFLAVFFGLRWTYRFVSKAFPQRSAHRPLHRRLIEVIVHTFAGVAALGASLIVLSAAGDWVLLGLVLLLIAGIAWASKMAIPRYLAEMRLLLNLGTVREAERVVYNGLPYRVSRLGIQTHLTNPALEGGYVRLPISDLTEMRSRPIAPGDLWFPCRLGDFVLLSDGQRGEVIKLTPELVRISLLGGSEVTYTTSDFLGLSPENISRDFRLFVTFGIDYEHQAICTTEVAPKMQAALQSGLTEIIGDADINSLKVEFKEAAASSLDYAIMIDFSGDVAARYAMLNRAIQRILVDLCNAEGWGIPFTQVVVHQA